MNPWLGNRPGALLTGLVLGVAVQEAIRSAVDAFVLLGALDAQLVQGTAAPGIAALLLISALAGGVAAGMVTAALCGGLRTGIAAGVLLAIPAVVLAAVLLDGSMLAVLHAAPPVCGAALGARLAVPAPPQPARAPAESPPPIDPR